MSQPIFAYGSNMCPGRLREYNVEPLGPGAVAHLRGQALRFNKRSTDRSGKANVVPWEGDVVWGVLYSVTNEDLRHLNAGERGYTPQQLTVAGPAGDVQAWVHIADQSSDDPTLRPYTWYKRFLVQGALVHRLPVEYRAMLEAVDASEDPDQARDRRKRAIACE